MTFHRSRSSRCHVLALEALLRARRPGGPGRPTVTAGRSTPVAAPVGEGANGGPPTAGPWTAGP
ncbi:hypothetical protein KPATCC21470_8184 [Kitasatospora purpeofusca]